MNCEYGIQMYSLCDLAQNDLAAALKTVGDLGYSYVEFAGFFGHTADEVCRMLEDARVAVKSAHGSYKELKSDVIDETIAFHKAIGNKNFVIPMAKLNTLEQIDEFVSIVNPAQEKLAANGISLGYHNHSDEFVTRYWGMNAMAELEKRTELDFQIDVYWAFNAGIDPVVYCERLKDRIKYIHLMDGLLGGRGKGLGEGHVSLEPIIAMAKANGFGMIVESEGFYPTGVEEVTRCMDFLKIHG